MPDGARSKTALVLAGGGSFGAIQAGMLHSLATHGIAADMVVGSSVGSLNGAYYAGNPTLEGIERLETIWRGLRRSDVFPLSLATVLGFLIRRNFLVEPDGLQALIETNLTYRNLEDAKIPIHIVATDILTGGTVVLSEGPAAQAIIASAAIPVVFPPVRFEDVYLVDGAVSSNTAVKVAVDQGARRLIVLPTGYACALSKPPAGAVASALHALTLLVARQLLSELKELDGSNIEYFVLPPLCPLTGSPYDFSQSGALIDRAITSTDAWIADGGLEKPNVHAQLSIHKHANQNSVRAGQHIGSRHSADVIRSSTNGRFLGVKRTLFRRVPMSSDSNSGHGKHQERQSVGDRDAAAFVRHWSSIVPACRSDGGHRGG